MTETNAERLNRITKRAGLSCGLNNADLNWLIEQAEQKSDTDEITVTKYKKGEPTVIDWNGERWIKDTQTTFKGGVQRGKQNKSTK